MEAEQRSNDCRAVLVCLADEPLCPTRSDEYDGYVPVVSRSTAAPVAVSTLRMRFGRPGLSVPKTSDPPATIDWMATHSYVVHNGCSVAPRSVEYHTPSPLLSPNRTYSRRFTGS